MRKQYNALLINSGTSGTAPAATEAPAAQPEAEPAG